MTALALVLAGTVFGFVLNWIRDIRTEQRQAKRQDLVWRRERYTEAAAELLAYAPELVSANWAFARETAYMVRSQQGPPMTAEAARDNQTRREAASNEARAAIMACTKASELIRLYAPGDVYIAAKALFEAARAQARDSAPADLGTKDVSLVEAVKARS